MAAFTARFGIPPWRIEDLTPEELAVHREYLRQQLQQEQDG